MSVSAHGFWIFFEPSRRELFLPFRTFPWFADATIRELADVTVEHGRVLRWPSLDVDLDVARIEHPERYPLVSMAGRKRRPTRARTASRALHLKPGA